MIDEMLETHRPCRKREKEIEEKGARKFPDEETIVGNAARPVCVYICNKCYISPDVIPALYYSFLSAPIYKMPPEDGDGDSRTEKVMQNEKRKEKNENTHPRT